VDIETAPELMSGEIRHVSPTKLVRMKGYQLLLQLLYTDQRTLTLLGG